MRGLLAALLVLLLVAPVRAADPLVGWYDVAGESESGTYTALAEIVQTDGTYHVQWVFPNGVRANGVAVKGKDRIVVAFVLTGLLGVSDYQITKQRLVGTWTLYGAGRTYRETLTKRTTAPELPPVSAPAPSRPPQGQGV